MKPLSGYRYLGRFAAIVLGAELLQMLIVWLVPHPRPWMVMPAVMLIPLLTAAFVIYPLAKESESRGGAPADGPDRSAE